MTGGPSAGDVLVRWFIAVLAVSLLWPANTSWVPSLVTFLIIASWMTGAAIYKTAQWWKSFRRARQR